VKLSGNLSRIQKCKASSATGVLASEWIRVSPHLR